MQGEPDKDIKHAVDTGMGWEDVWFLSSNHKRELFKIQKYSVGDCNSIAKALEDSNFWIQPLVRV